MLEPLRLDNKLIFPEKVHISSPSNADIDQKLREIQRGLIKANNERTFYQ